MRSYQSVVILKPDLDDTQVSQAQEKIGGFISKHGGEILHCEVWGKKRLAYRVKKSRFGIYLNIYHTCDESKIHDLETEFKLYDLLIKYLVIRIEADELEWAMGKIALAEGARQEESAGEGATVAAGAVEKESGESKPAEPKPVEPTSAESRKEAE